MHVYKSAPFVANNDVCRLLITFANNLDPDHDRQNVSAQFYFIEGHYLVGNSIRGRRFFYLRFPGDLLLNMLKMLILPLIATFVAC